jgi:hypothetical protein
MGSQGPGREKKFFSGKPAGMQKPVTPVTCYLPEGPSGLKNLQKIAGKKSSQKSAKFFERVIRDGHSQYDAR